MHTYVQRGAILSVDPPATYRVRLDLGFRVYVEKTFSASEPYQGVEVGTDILVGLSHENGRPHVHRMVAAADVAFGPTWSYPARVIHFVDGDTIDAEVQLGFGMTIQERFRLAEIQAPELHGPGTDLARRQRAHEALRYVVDRIGTYWGNVTLITSKRGKWRRWLAWVVLDPKKPTLNAELVLAGLAEFID